MKTIDRLITIDNLLKRWPGLTEEDIVSHMGTTTFDDDSVLNGYLHIKTLRRQDGKPIHYCEATPVFPRSRISENGVPFDWSGRSEISLGIVFDLDDVERMESSHPEFRNAIILPDEILQIVEPTQQGAGDWINCDTLAGRWKCSPFDVVQAIIKKGLNLKVVDENTRLEHDTLDNFSAHRVDLAKFETKYAEYIASLSEIIDSDFWPMMRKAELLVFPPQHETLLSGNRPTHSVQEIVTGLLSLVGEENNREERTDIEVQPIVPASQSPATIKNYSARMPEIIKGVLDVKAEWEAKDPNSLIRQCGFSSDELKKIVPTITDKGLWKAFRHALNECGIKIHLDRGPRTLPEEQLYRRLSPYCNH